MIHDADAELGLHLGKPRASGDDPEITVGGGKVQA